MANKTSPPEADFAPAIPNRWLILLNPVAGNGLGKKQWPRIERQLQDAGISYSVQFTRHKGHATELTIDGIQKGFRQLAAVGGDGTNNEVINGIMQQTATEPQHILYTLLSFGTGNDWVRSHPMSGQLRSFAERLQTKKTIRQDIGLVEYRAEGQTKERYFSNLAGMAYDAYLVGIIEQNKRRLSNKILYFFYLFKCIFDYSLQHARVAFNDQTVEDKFYSINVGICKYAGGGMQLAPHAIANDGLLALTLIRKISKLGVLLNTHRLYNGTIEKHPQIELFQSGEIRVNSNDARPLQLEVDGELIGTAPAIFTVIPQSLTIVIDDVGAGSEM
ncbi:MAG: diacylglycerol kinase family protein [Bacteroidota bacterium]